jgi:hypothetical protein
MELTFTLNQGQLNAINTHITTIIKNIEVELPNAMMDLMNSAQKLAMENTHQGATKRLYAAWRVIKQQGPLAGGTISLVNPMPYALTEFSRSGIKTKGSPPLGGPHNIIPSLIDFVSTNAGTYAVNGIFKGVPK